MPDLGYGCACGKLRGTVADVTPAACSHVLCHCHDCRSAYTYLGHEDPGVVDLIQTSQDRIRVTEGRDKLRAFRHTPRGALRWYAACCDLPLFVTPLRPRLVHVGMNADRLDDPVAIGPVRGEGFIRTPDGKVRHKNILFVATRLVSRVVGRNVTGEWRETPFFDAAGEPVRDPKILARAERSEALSALRR
ncbi:DUF6151 family protein [uncultured Jannaschia sp.]|uniref:DUF6151 family protein n=1 Tax=uncultured Jannaschia sp. TaxID=293347 RepID=UPI00260471B0|nr:DUF6151 family protein [uncultured Jannaschia sp.]